MGIPLLHLPEVWHIGRLDPADRGKLHSESLEAHCLSVSLCPEAWQRIARLGGSPVHFGKCPTAQFVDVHRIGREAEEEILEWARSEGLIRSRSMWRAWHWDDEAELWGYMLLETREEALEQLDEMPLDTDDIESFLQALADEYPDLPPAASSLVEETVIQELTDAGLDRTDRRAARGTDATDLAIMFWVEDVLRDEMPEVVGVWWNEHYDPDNFSAPRGGIFPSCMEHFVFSRTQWLPDDEELLATMPDATVAMVEVPRPAP